MAKKVSGTAVPKKYCPASEARIMSTTDGRQFLPDVLQQIYGDKSFAAFERYGRVLAVAVPLEAIRMLAGETIEKSEELRIQGAARNLLTYLEPDE